MWGLRRLAILIATVAVGSCAPEPPVPAPPPPVALLPPQPAEPPAPTPSYSEEQLSCLALTIYWEGRSESRRGQVAIAHVVLNRAHDPNFPDTICGVAHQGGQTPRLRCQFHWWCDGKSDTPTNAAQWEAAQKIARSETQPGAHDPTGGALYFHNGTVRPDWSRVRTRTAKIGQHTFYR
jgi:spore germination cell wall hydrolase CwlJ-like protein